MHSLRRIPVLGCLALTAALVVVPFAERAGGQEAPDLEAFCRTRATIEALFGTNDEQAVETALLS